jgi:hypothetical protein
MKIVQAIKTFKGSNRQTKYFIFMWMLYIVALIWTTVQAFARLEYSRSDVSRPIIIQTSDNSS